MKVWSRLATLIEEDGQAALITLADLRGSGPRDADARMVVRTDGSHYGTIGGGALEWEALRFTAVLLAENQRAGKLTRQALGPELGQCCGGMVEIRTEAFQRGDLDWITPLAALEQTTDVLRTHAYPDASGCLVRRPAAFGDTRRKSAIVETFGARPTPLLLFGAGHVGRAIVLALAPLPFSVTWIDTRPDAFPSRVPANVTSHPTDNPVGVLETAPHDAMIAVMTHSHPLDLALVARALFMNRFAYIGLIGSETKKARFLRQLAAAGLGPEQNSRLTCPIGGRSIVDKSPAAIAVSCAFEFMQVRGKLSAAPGTQTNV